MHSKNKDINMKPAKPQKVTLNRLVESQDFASHGILPSRPSKLIRLALGDLQAAVKAGYGVDMDAWVRKTASGKCTVCFAGACMVSQFGQVAKMAKKAKTGEGVMPADLSDDEIKRLKALDLLRMGKIKDALLMLDTPNNEIPFNMKGNVCITQYDEDPKRFFEQMNEMADAFEQLGF